MGDADTGVSSGTALEAPPDGSSMDFDYLDELLLDGCWLETSTTADGSDFLLQMQTPSSSNPFFDPSFTNDGNQQGTQSPLLNDKAQPLSKDIVNYHYQSEIPLSEEVVRRWWIGPTATASPGPSASASTSSSSVMERLIKALICINESNIDKDVLTQIWVPVNRGGRRILTTSELPFSLESRCPNLEQYREISARYQFSAEEDSKSKGKGLGLAPGLPGRVFMNKVPEWTPDVRFFTSDEYPRVDHAQQCDVRGTLALPIFEQGSRTCLGVIEVVMTIQQISYGRQLENVCKALEAVDLRSSKLSSTQNVKACNKSFEAALPEIQEVLRSACEMHKLPLAQTWIPCFQQGKEGCRHSDDNYLRCISPLDHACYVGNPSVQLFHEACSEHHLLKGQGVAGGAFTTNQPCFSTDITSLSKTDYPLSHDARMFGLRAAVAIRLRSIHGSADDFVLEFFLPVDCIDSEEQKKMLTSLSKIIQRVCYSLRVITDREQEKETNLSVDAMISTPADSKSVSLELQQNGMVTLTSLGTEGKSSETTRRRFSDQRQQQESSILKGNPKCDLDCSTFGEGSLSSVGIRKTREKRGSKAEKTITPQVLRQYFAGSLKDAAKNIGVCTTTLKRICRQHGIKRWPSRKIKKVGHSLQKLQLVIDSVQGASSAIQIDSFYSNFSGVASPNLAGTSLLSTPKQTNQPINLLSTQPEAAAPKSPSSSCSQGSISSHSCSIMSAQRNEHHSEDPVIGAVSADTVLKRIRSEAELKNLSQDRAVRLPRSQSQETLGERPRNESHRPFPQTDDAYRVKVTYGDEKTRFRMPKNWSYEDLLQEIARRYNVSDFSKFDVKYLDDDCEWILLTCDADLEECFDIYQSSKRSTIKLCLQVSNHF